MSFFFFGMYVRWNNARIMKFRVLNILLWKVPPNMIHIPIVLVTQAHTTTTAPIRSITNQKTNLKVAGFVIFQLFFIVKYEN
jgi:hypothetical protein